MNKLMIVLLLLFLPVVLLAQRVKNDCIQASDRICAMEKEMFRLINVEREKRGVKPLAYLQEYAYVARDWSKQQYEMDDISHDGFPEKRARLLRQKFGKIPYDIRAENCVMTTGSDDDEYDIETVDELFDALINSRDHRFNILDREATHVGVGFHVEAGKYYATQIFAIKNPPRVMTAVRKRNKYFLGYRIPSPA